MEDSILGAVETISGSNRQILIITTGSKGINQGANVSRREEDWEEVNKSVIS